MMNETQHSAPKVWNTRSNFAEFCMITPILLLYLFVCLFFIFLTTCAKVFLVLGFILRMEFWDLPLFT